MNDKQFKIDSQAAHTWNVVSGVALGLGMIPLLFWGLGSMDGGNDLSRWAKDWWLLGLVLMVAGTAILIYVKFFYHSTLTLTTHPNAGLQLSIHEPNGSELSANGTWKWYAYHTRHYARYGMYRKEQYLILYHKDKEYVVFRKNFGVMDDPPAVFRLSPGEIDAGGAPVYRVRDIDEILQIVANSSGAQNVISSQQVNT